MANYAKAKLNPVQKRKLNMLKELRRNLAIVIDEIEIDGADVDCAITAIINRLQLERLV